MADELPGIKHITLTCPVAKCQEKAFVQVVVQKSLSTQRRIDTMAKAKLKEQLTAWHKEGLHNGR